MMIVAAMTVLSFAGNAVYAKSTWETIRSEQVPESKVVARDQDFELRAVRGAIIVSTNHTVQIKVYSILGQLIAQDNLQAGTYRLGISSHGVYIVKVGMLTCKVAV